MPTTMAEEITERALTLLIQRVRRGDREALGQLFDLHGESVYRVVFRLLGSREDAEDAVQDVFGGLRLSLAKYEEKGAFGAWLRRVAARTALMRLRADRRRDSVALEEHRDAAPPERREDLALRMTLDHALAALPDRLRAVFVLRMVEGYSHDEIAGALHITVSASKVRLHRAVRRLQHALRGSL